MDRRLDLPVLDGDHLLELMSRVVELAVDHIPGADCAAITIEFDRAAPFTAILTDDDVFELTLWQTGTRSGPSLLASHTGHRIDVDLSGMGRLWPDLAITAHECGINRICAAPLHRTGRTVGSLDLFTRASTLHTVDADCPVLTHLVMHLDRCLDEYSNQLAVANYTRTQHSSH